MNNNKRVSIKERRERGDIAPIDQVLPLEGDIDTISASEEKAKITDSKNIDSYSLISEKYPTKVKTNITYDHYADLAVKEIKKNHNLSCSMIINKALIEYLKNNPEIQSLAEENNKIKKLIESIRLDKQ